MSQAQDPDQDQPEGCFAGTRDECPIPPHERIHERRQDDPWRHQVTADIKTLQEQHGILTAGLKTNTELTQQVYENTRAIVQAVEGAGNLWAFLSKWWTRGVRGTRFLLKWITLIGGALVVVYQVADASTKFDLWAWLKTNIFHVTPK